MTLPSLTIRNGRKVIATGRATPWGMCRHNNTGGFAAGRAIRGLPPQPSALGDSVDIPQPGWGRMWYTAGVMGIERFAVSAPIALMLTLFVWLGGGIVAPWLSPWTPWLTLLLAEVALVVPEQRGGESLFEARRRVWRGLARDPLTWCAVALIVFLVVQWLNGCAFVVWDATARGWELVSPAFDWLLPEGARAKIAALPAPSGAGDYVWYELGSQPWGWLPWCLRSDEAWGVLNWFPPALVAALAARHALTGRTQRRLMGFVCVMSGVLAVAGMAQ